jgi:hypothetical protein
VKLEAVNEPDGTLTLHLEIRNVRLRPRKKSREFWIADFEGKTGLVFNCGGIDKPMRLVLKAYMRLKHREAAFLELQKHPEPERKQLSNG